MPFSSNKDQNRLILGQQEKSELSNWVSVKIPNFCFPGFRCLFSTGQDRTGLQIMIFHSNLVLAIIK